MRQEIFKFLQDKLIRVSVFLQENLQNNDGSIVIPTKGIGGVFVKRPGLLKFNFTCYYYFIILSVLIPNWESIKLSLK